MPSLIVYFGVWLFMKESPRFLIADGQIQEGIEILNYISEYNGMGESKKITSDEMVKMKEWADQTFAAEKEGSS